MAQRIKKSRQSSRPARPKGKGRGGARTAVKPRPPATKAGRKAAGPKPGKADPLHLVRKVLSGCDQFFLSRQVSYAVSMSEGLPHAWVDEALAKGAMDSLLRHLVLRSPRKGSLSVILREFALQSGPGVEFCFSATDRFLREADRKSFMATLFDGRCDPETRVSLAELREHVMHQHGRLWAEAPEGNRIEFHMIFPSSMEVAHRALAGQRAFRYDIAITNYPTIRKRFGIIKGRHLVEQVEHYVRSLVRYPVDSVTANLDKGMITAIYDAQPGAAESVSARISKRLGQETFQIGRRPVDVSFKYELTSLIRPRIVAGRGLEGSA